MILQRCMGMRQGHTGCFAVFVAGLFSGCGLAFLVGGANGPARAPAQSARADAIAPPPLREGSVLRYPAEVLRVLDGDTFEARVRVWPGLDMTTKVRLLQIDAPELHARCTEERRRAEAARDRLAVILGDGAVAISGVRPDKYGGRVLANAATWKTPDVSAEMLADGLARPYAGGRRASWCGLAAR
jgi:endonuclease YncB( thermonuclease family)